MSISSDQGITTELHDAGRVTAAGTVRASAERLFEFLRDPAHHAQLDGSGMIRAASEDPGSEGQAHAGPLTEPGQVFVMDMLWTDGTTRYRVENTVTALSPERIEWLVADYGQPAQGWKWGWQLQPGPEEGTTRVTNYCDWSEITDPQVLAEKDFPVVDPEQVAGTVARLKERFEQG